MDVDWVVASSTPVDHELLHGAQLTDVSIMPIPPFSGWISLLAVERGVMAIMVWRRRLMTLPRAAAAQLAVGAQTHPEAAAADVIVVH